MGPLVAPLLMHPLQNMTKGHPLPLRLTMDIRIIEILRGTIMGVVWITLPRNSLLLKIPPPSLSAGTFALTP